MNSKLIVEECLKLMNEHKYELMNFDSTILAEKPKISPYRLEVRKTLSDILGIPLENISFTKH